MANSLLRERGRVIVDDPAISHASRRRWAALAASHDVDATAIIVCPPLDVLLERHGHRPDRVFFDQELRDQWASWQSGHHRLLELGFSTVYLSDGADGTWTVVE